MLFKNFKNKKENTVAIENTVAPDNVSDKVVVADDIVADTQFDEKTDESSVIEPIADELNTQMFEFESEPTYGDSFDKDPFYNNEYDFDDNSDSISSESDAEKQEQSSDVSGRFAVVSFEKNKKKKEKKPMTKKAKAIMLSAIAVTLAVAILLVSFNFTAIIGFFIKNFCSDATYFKYVETVAFSSYSDDASELYKQLSALFPADNCKDIQLTLDAEETAISLAQTYTVEEYGIGLGFINNTTVDATVNTKDNRTQANATVYMSNQEVAELEYKKLSDTGEIFFSVPSHTDKYLAYDTTVRTNDLSELLNDKDIKDALPSNKKISKFLTKYIKIAAKEITNVKGSDKQVVVGTTTQKVRVLEFTLDSNTLNAIKKNVYTELKSDEKFKEYVDDIGKVLADKGEIESADKLYSQIIESIDKDLNQIAKYESNPDNKELFTLVDYVDSKHRIVGRDIIKDGKALFSYLKLNENYVVESNIDTNGLRYQISGDGKMSGDILTGEYTLSVDNTLYCGISLDNLDINQMKKGSIITTISITPTSEFYSSLPIQDISQFRSMRPKLKCSLNISKEKSTLDAKLLVETLQIAKLSAVATDGTIFDVSRPSDNNIIESENSDDFFNSIKFRDLFDSIYKSGMLKHIKDFSQFVNTLVDLGLPEAIGNLLNSLYSLYQFIL